MDEITARLLNERRSADPTSPDASLLDKAQAFDAWQAQKQMEALGKLKPDEPVRLKARREVWASACPGGDAFKYFAREVFEVPYAEAKTHVEKRVADVTTEPLTQAAIERRETHLGQKAYSQEQWDQGQRRMAAVAAAMRGDL